MLKQTFLVIRNSLRKSPTLQYPKEKMTMPERFRGRHIFNDSLCIGCSLCAHVCPNNTIVMMERPEQTDPKKIRRPIIDLNRCIFCGYCAEVCPTKCLVMGHGYETAAKDKKELIMDHDILTATPKRPDNYKEVPGWN